MKTSTETMFDVRKNKECVASYNFLSQALAFARLASVADYRTEVNMVTRKNYDFEFKKLAEFKNGQQVYGRTEW
jgi:hypothetical protein